MKNTIIHTHLFYALLSEAYKKGKKQPPRETIKKWVEKQHKKTKRFLGLQSLCF